MDKQENAILSPRDEYALQVFSELYASGELEVYRQFLINEERVLSTRATSSLKTSTLGSDSIGQQPKEPTQSSPDMSVTKEKVLCIEKASNDEPDRDPYPGENTLDYCLGEPEDIEQNSAQQWMPKLSEYEITQDLNFIDRLVQKFEQEKNEGFDQLRVQILSTSQIMGLSPPEQLHEHKVTLNWAKELLNKQQSLIEKLQKQLKST